jgi:hypothetical protein
VSRYYKIVISDPKSGAIWHPTATGALVRAGTMPLLQGTQTTDAAGIVTLTIPGQRPGANVPYTFTSHPNGNQQPPDPGALNIEFEASVKPADTPAGGTLIRVHGVGLQMLSQSSNLNGQDFALYGGMGKGLPLANPAQAGLIAKGTVFQAFGNWEGTDQSLDLVINPGGLHPEDSVNFAWNPGTTLADALATTFAQAFPDYQPSIKITSFQPPKNAAQAGSYASLNSFARYLRELTQPLGAQLTRNKNYPGVRIGIRGSSIYAYDSPAKTIALNFQDLIGQPTWMSAVSISFKTVLRADIWPGDLMTFPKGIFTPYALTSPSAAVPNAPASSKVAFQGSFFVTEVDYFANFRDPDARAWNTSFVATVVGQLDPDL